MSLCDTCLINGFSCRDNYYIKNNECKNYVKDIGESHFHKVDETTKEPYNHQIGGKIYRAK